MEFTDQQLDALVELVNIAFGRAAASLSDLTGRRVTLSVPRVSVHSIDELSTVFSTLMKDEIATVHQIFSGSVAGSALLMLDYNGAVHLSSLLRENRGQLERLDTSDCEVCSPRLETSCSAHALAPLETFSRRTSLFRFPA